MKTYYIIQKPVHRPGMNVLLEFDAADEDEAQTTFIEYVRTMLVEDPNFNCRFVRFERTLGGWIDRSWAHATAEDLLDGLPDWFIRSGFYDEHDNLVLEAREIIDRITYQDYSYFVTSLKPEHPAINGYNRYDYIPVEGIRQPKPEPKELTMKFETINGQLCRMVEPEPLTPEANFPCVVRLIQDDSPMGRNNDFYATSHLLAHIEIINGLDAIHFVRWQGIKTYYSHFEIIGYPVTDGSLEWALYQIRSGKKVVKEGGGEQYGCSFYENRLFYLNGSGCLVTKNGIGLIDPCSEGEFLSLDETGWQLYEKPEPLLSDAKIGDICKRRDGCYTQFYDKRRLKDGCLLYYFNDAKGAVDINGKVSPSKSSDNDIIHREPLAAEGTAEWAWQMAKLGIETKCSRGKIRISKSGMIEVCYNGMAYAMPMTQSPENRQYVINKMRECSPDGWQLYEPEPDAGTVCDACGLLKTKEKK